VRGSTRFHKTVHFFLMQPMGGAIEDHDAEFDEVRWTDLEEALAILNHATERSVVEEAGQVLAEIESNSQPMTEAEASA
jgi:hypothetical protein